MKTIFAISGSTRKNSSNEKLLYLFKEAVKNIYEVHLFNGIDTLPHFNPDRDDNPPKEVTDFVEAIEKADAILICTPEYVFSIPGSLKNAIEWCVSKTAFLDKPTGIITASASGQKGHEELQMILATLQAKVSPETSLLIQGARGKIDDNGMISDAATQDQLNIFISNFSAVIK